MASARWNESARSDRTHKDSLDPEDCDFANLSKEITDALTSYEQTAAPVFGTTTTIEATSGPEIERRHHWINESGGPTTDSIDVLHLPIKSVKSTSARTETTVCVDSSDLRESDGILLRQRVSPWIQRSSFQAVRNGVGSIFQRGSGSGNSKVSNPRSKPSQTPSTTYSRASTKDTSIDETASFRNFLDHAFESDIVEEPLEGDKGSLEELKPTSTRLGKLAQREAVKAARKAERTLRKTASAGNLPRRHQEPERKPEIRTQKEFHGFMGSDFVY